MTSKPETRKAPGGRQKSLHAFTNQPSFDEDREFLARARARNKKSKTIAGIPRPFMKWAGGKRQLLGQFDPFIPAKFNKYIEPFVGGGAMFFYLLPERAVLMDINPELINIYKVIQHDVDALIASLKRHENDETYYYKMRDIDLDKDAFAAWTDVEKASRNIYMNHVCYNGLYRVNSEGHFNVPFGDYKNPILCDEENLRAINKALKGIELHVASFEKCLEYAEKGDFIYLDPPYVPLSLTASFTGYTKESFGPDDQRKLLAVMKELDRRGCKVLLSNSYCDFVLDLYKDFKIETIMANRAINSVGSKRGKIKEVLIRNEFT
ncbi:MAG: DNA adenine methylase [Candidatus Sigynarchaeota archaeon]